ncbi:M13 family metallopeptidase [Terriglobus tenax]|uniref:M13 family metallopeptidase n=1 Tax=Terriglobus tenax TaxID=1111115 RepID=UPI0021DF66F1|nr:M13 family metallopeptidase [Terriglobus tenax]
MKRFAAVLLSCVLLPVSTFAQQGARVQDIDKSLSPCDDFDNYANGQWRKQNAMPAIQTSWALRTVTQEETTAKLRGLLDEASSKKQTTGSTEQLIGDFYGSCMDEAAVNAAGLKPLQPTLAKIDALQDARAVQAEMIELMKVGIHAPLNISSSQDPHAPLNTIADISLRGLGLPDRDYYLRNEPRYKAIREKYMAHVQKMFVLADYSEAQAQAATDAVLKIETSLAEARLSRVELREPKNTDHPMQFAELAKQYPGFDWAAMYKALNVPAGKLNLSQPKLTSAFLADLKGTSVAEWKAYLRWHVLHANAAYLPAAFVDENFAFFGTVMTGVKEQRPRWQRCSRLVDAQLGEALGKKYVEVYFSPEAKARAREMAVNIAEQLKLSITSNDWMTAATKAKALEKVSALNIKVGYPDKWKDYSSIKISRASFLGDVMSTQAFAVRDDLALIGRPLDRGRWEMTPPTMNAYYNPQMNEVVVPAGYLQPPGFNPKGLDAINYGAIGVTIGHEISHGVDDEGAQFAADGSLTMWWTPEDFEKFKAKTACTTQQYDNYFIEPGIHHNGKLVTGEALGDLGGVNLAYRAYEKSREGKGPEPTVDGLTPEQQFFLAEAQWRGALVRPEAARSQVQVDPHPLGKWRVLGPLSNMPEFEKAWSCRKGNAMVREEKCRVW